MIELNIKTTNGINKILININYLVYADFVGNEVLYIQIKDRPFLELTNAVLVGTTITEVYEHIKLQLVNLNHL